MIADDDDDNYNYYYYRPGVRRDCRQLPPSPSFRARNQLPGNRLDGAEKSLENRHTRLKQGQLYVSVHSNRVLIKETRYTVREQFVIQLKKHNAFIKKMWIVPSLCFVIDPSLGARYLIRRSGVWSTHVEHFTL